MVKCKVKNLIFLAGTTYLLCDRSITMERQEKKIIITRRAWQFIILTSLVFIASFSRHNPLGFHFRIRLFGSIFLSVFYLTYLREERRAKLSADSNVIINWNLAEAVLLLFSILGFYVTAFIQHFDEYFFYAYYYIGLLGLLSGVPLGELFWQNIRLRKLDDVCRQRYWTNYKNSIW